MSNKYKLLYFILLMIGILIVTLMFIYEKPNGVLGFLTFLIGLELIIVSIIKLWKASKTFQKFIKGCISIIPWI